ncbi:MAG: Gfo/Idh/MocA family oxidoreductase [Ruminococcaceae bacterium]|nr:Gfo/Idh/MocA family oxidoreductase [Oscillospiraceae bacterium]
MKKLAMIGCGGIGNYHLGHFLKYDDIELAGFCDLIPEKAQAFVEKAGSGKAFTDWREMYDEIQPDMVFICIPPYCHGEIEFETIRRGIPMFVEKPVALDLDLARRIRDEIEKAGLITAVGFQCRYSNIVDDTKAFVARNQIYFANCFRMGGIPGTDWWKNKALSGGQIVEQTIHNLDMMRYILGEPVEVFTMGTRGFIKDVEGYDTDDLTSTIIRFESGALGTVSTGCYAKGGQCSDNTITFSAKDARLNHYIINKVQIYGEAPEVADPNANEFIKGDGAMRADGGEVITIKDQGQAGDLCDRTFVDAVLSGDGSKILSPYADALRTLEFVMACNQSMDSNLPIKIEHK